MQISDSSDPRVLPLGPSLSKRFYEAVVLLNCLQNAYRSADLIEPPETTVVATGSPKKLFHNFVNKLGHICDSKRGGDTATSFAVLQPGTTIQYRFASYRRSAKQLDDVKVYVAEVLTTLGCAAGGAVDEENIQSALFVGILQKILLFNRRRVLSYVRSMKLGIEVGMGIISNAETDEDGAVLREMITLCPLVEFATRTPQVDDAEFATVSRALLHAIDGHYRSNSSFSLVRYLQHKIRLDPAGLDTPWNTLYHTMGRLYSYLNAVRVLISARRLWPSLFTDFEVVPIMSSKPGPSPRAIRRSLSGIFSRMTANSNILNLYHRNATFLQSIGLDKRVQEMSKFRPMVHAEVLVDDSVRRINCLNDQNGHTPVPFFNEAIFGKYIGSGKPVCHLCGLYFAARSGDDDAVEVRESHPKVYCNWRAPDVLEGDNCQETNEQQRRLKLEYMVKALRNTIWSALDNRLVAMRRFESSDSLVVQLSDNEEMDTMRDGDNADVALVTTRESVGNSEQDGSTIVSGSRANPSRAVFQSRAGTESTTAYINTQAYINAQAAGWPGIRHDI